MPTPSTPNPPGISRSPTARERAGAGTRSCHHIDGADLLGASEVGQALGDSWIMFWVFRENHARGAGYLPGRGEGGLAAGGSRCEARPPYRPAMDRWCGSLRVIVSHVCDRTSVEA